MRKNARFLVQILLISSAILTGGLLGLKSAIAATSNTYAQSANPDPQGAETQPSIPDLVTPTDSAFPLLQAIVERYGCISESVYYRCQWRCSRNVTRLEFADILNVCVVRVNELIAEGKTDLVRQEDIANLKQLEQEFAAELAIIRRGN